MEEYEEGERKSRRGMTRLDSDALDTQVWDISSLSVYEGPRREVAARLIIADQNDVIPDESVFAVPPPRKSRVGGKPPGGRGLENIPMQATNSVVVQSHLPAKKQAVPANNKASVIVRRESASEHLVDTAASTIPAPDMYAPVEPISEEAQGFGEAVCAHEDTVNYEGVATRVVRRPLVSFVLVVSGLAFFYGLTAVATPGGNSGKSSEVTEGRLTNPWLPKVNAGTAVVSKSLHPEPAEPGAGLDAERATQPMALREMESESIGLEPIESKPTQESAIPSLSHKRRPSDQWVVARQVGTTTPRGEGVIVVEPAAAQRAQEPQSHVWDAFPEELGTYPLASKKEARRLMSTPPVSPSRTKPKEVEEVVQFPSSTPSAPFFPRQQQNEDTPKPQKNGPATTRYRFSPDNQYVVVTTPKHETELILREGERVLETPMVGGNSESWKIRVVRSPRPQSDSEQWFVRLIPLRANLETTLTVDTTSRSYRISLSSTANGRYMPAVRWNYPHEDARQRSAAVLDVYAEKKRRDDVVDPANIRRNYAMYSSHGELQWAPVAVFDDKKRTFIEFPPGLTRMPRLEIRASTGDAETSPQYWQKDNYYIVDRVLDKGRLTLAIPGSRSSTGEVGKPRTEVITVVRQGDK